MKENTELKQKLEEANKVIQRQGIQARKRDISWERTTQPGISFLL